MSAQRLSGIQDHRNLRVWRHAHQLAVRIRRETADFHAKGFISLQSQMVRAAESVVLNIAEGCGATSQREFARFLGIAIKSSFELEAQCELAKDYDALSNAVWQDLQAGLISVRRMLFALRKKVLLSPHAKRITGASPTTVKS